MVRAGTSSQLQMTLQMKLICQDCPRQFRVKSHCVPVFASVSYILALCLSWQILHHHFQGQCSGVHTPAGLWGKDTPLLLCTRQQPCRKPTNQTTSEWGEGGMTIMHWDNLKHPITLKLFFLIRRVMYLLTVEKLIIINVGTC